jgi:hypothetical protein
MAQWAGIEFDPRVVNALLNLDPLPELESFAESQAEIEARAAASAEPQRSMFSSFS